MDHIDAFFPNVEALMRIEFIPVVSVIYLLIFGLFDKLFRSKPIRLALSSSFFYLFMGCFIGLNDQIGTPISGIWFCAIGVMLLVESSRPSVSHSPWLRNSGQAILIAILMLSLILESHFIEWSYFTKFLALNSLLFFSLISVCLERIEVQELEGLFKQGLLWILCSAFFIFSSGSEPSFHFLQTANDQIASSPWQAAGFVLSLVCLLGLFPLHMPSIDFLTSSHPRVFTFHMILRVTIFFLILSWLKLNANQVNPQVFHVLGWIGLVSFVWMMLQTLMQNRFQRLVSYGVQAALSMLLLSYCWQNNDHGSNSLAVTTFSQLSLVLVLVMIGSLNLRVFNRALNPVLISDFKLLNNELVWLRRTWWILGLAIFYFYFHLVKGSLSQPLSLRFIALMLAGLFSLNVWVMIVKKRLTFC